MPEHRAVAVSVAMAARRLVAAHWGLLAVSALFLLVGALVLDDYGLATDEAIQREIGMAAVDYLAGDERAYDQLTSAEVNRYYGVAFEAPLILVERVLGLEDSRDVWLSRHYLTHLFFLAGGVFSYVLVLRMFGSRLLALVAMALFLLHPRLYAHSFFNSKDVPFAAMFMIALYLTHRAFRRETLGAFLVCGVGIGILVNLRPLGLVLFGAVLALRGLDLLAGERKRVLLTGMAFALVAALTSYVALPGIWAEPLGGGGEAWSLGAAHPNPVSNLFRGEWLFGPDGAPFEYIPVWIGITSPPGVLLLAVIGVAGLCWGVGRRPHDSWRATPLRFNLLLLALVVAPIIAIFALQTNIYNGWRHVYFLYAPLTLLAVAGLHWILSWADRRWMRVGVYSLAGTGLAVVLVSMVRIHPLEDSYYNGLVDRSTPDYLVSQYHTGYWWHFYWPLIQEIVEDHPEQEIRFSAGERKFMAQLLPESKRMRVSRDRAVFSLGFHSDRPVSAREYVLRIYNNTIAILRGRQVPPEGREAIIEAALSGEPVARSFFDLYLHDNMVVFFREECMAGEDIGGTFIVTVYPHDTAVLPGWLKEFGSVSFANNPDSSVVDDDGRCSWISFLPGFPIYRLDARQDVRQSDEGSTRWEVRVGIASPVDAEVLEGEPLASGAFDIHRDGDTLVYVRDGCTKEEEEAEFLAFFFPIDPDDLTEEVSRDDATGPVVMRTSFRLWDRGVRIGDRCITTLPLPDWPVASVQTGQYVEGGYLWRMRFAVTPPEVDPAVLAGKPLASGAFDIHRDGDALVYVKDECTEDDAEAPIIFHVYPVVPSDLPEASREYGFENRDFALWDHGARVAGRCLAVVPLPDYPIANVYTGQYDEAGERWGLDFSLVRPDAMLASLTGEPVASSVFDVYREGGALVYVREGCTEEDAGAGFFLHIVPADVDDLPADRVEHGFDNRDFTFATRGARMDGDCVAAVPLPGYPIASIRTGQYDETGDIWSVEFTLPDE